MELWRWSLDLNFLYPWSLSLQRGFQGLQGASVSLPPQLRDLARLSMGVPPCLVNTGTFPLRHLEVVSTGWMSLEVGEAQYRQVWWDVAQGPDTLLSTVPFSPPSDFPVPDPGPMVWGALLCRPGFDNCGCFTVASHCWGGHCHLETA